MSISNVLLIDQTIPDYTIFVTSVNASTLPIVYSRTTTRNELLSQLSAYTSIDRIGVVFSNNGANIFLENQPFFDSTPFSDNMNFILQVIQQWNVKNIDYLGCNTLNTPGWNEYYASLLEQTGVIVGASNNQTGNIQYGGDWVLESTGQDIEDIYFTQSIEYYTYLLDINYNSTIIIKQDNTLYGTGDNTYGQLGLGYSVYTNTITLIPNLTTTPSQVACGEKNTVVLMTDGTIYGTGLNFMGELTNIGTTSSFTLMTNLTGKTPKAIDSGSFHTIVLMTDNTIYGTGQNNVGQLANIPNGSTSLTLMTNSTGKIPKKIVCGVYHTIILMTDNTIYGTGFNDSGQLGINNLVNKSALTVATSTGKIPKDIACGTSHTVVLMTDGTLYGTGNNDYGQLGLGNQTNKSVLTVMPKPTGKTPSAIACGQYHTVVLMTDGTIYGAGLNYVGQLANLAYKINTLSLTLMTNSTGKTPSSISAGLNDTFVLMSDGSIYSVGKMANNYSTSINTLTLMTNSTGKTVSTLFPIVASKGDSVYFLGLMTDNSLYGMGFGVSFTANTLGLSTSLVTSFTNINVNKIPLYVAQGSYHTIVLMTDGTIYGTGNNDSGQLGLGNAIHPIESFTLIPNTTGKTPSAIACGYNHTVVLMTDGTIYGAGNSGYGQLANLSYENTLSLTLINNTTGKIPKSISCSTYSTLVLMTDGTIYGTGINSNGQLANIASYTTSLTLMTNSTGNTPSAIACGDTHTIVLMTDNTIYGTGNNGAGQLGLGNTTNQSSLTLMTNSTGKVPNSIACGDNHTNVLMTDGTLYGTGNNTDGQLGLGNSNTYNTLQLIPNLTSVNKLAGSSISISAISGDINNGSIACFKEGSLILTDKGYLPIQQLRTGDLVKTLLNGFVPICMIGKRDIFHVASTHRIKYQLYVCTNDKYPEVFEQLVITGCHSILVPRFTCEEERKKTIEVNGDTYVTDKKYRLPACVDLRASVYEHPGTYTIYHIALEHSDYYMNYGVYANGLLVETCSKRYLKELSNMEILE